MRAFYSLVAILEPSERHTIPSADVDAVLSTKAAHATQDRIEESKVSGHGQSDIQRWDGACNCFFPPLLRLEPRMFPS